MTWGNCVYGVQLVQWASVTPGVTLWLYVRGPYNAPYTAISALVSIKYALDKSYLYDSSLPIGYAGTRR